MASILRMLLHLSAVLALATSLAACASRPGPSLLHPVAGTTGVGTPMKVLMATTRKRSNANNQDFTSSRNFGLSYEQYSISVPPNHVPGKIEWPSSPPGDPTRNFVVTSASPLDESEFNRALFGAKKRGGDVIVFVHGYNTNYQEAVYRVGQLIKDSTTPNIVVGFAWPSLGTVTGYVADREASTYSRDYFEEFLNDLARAPGVRRIHIVAHSMGNWLTVETLRQAKIRGRSGFLPKLGEVLLMSPDIDVDVFRTQLDVIGKLNPPITVGVSRDDRALRISRRLAGGVPRVGAVLVSNPQAQDAIKHYGLRVIDMSDSKSIDSMHHSKFVSILPALREVTRNDSMVAAGNPISRTGVFVVDTAGTVLTVPLEAVAGQ